MTLKEIFNEISKREFKLFEKWSDSDSRTKEEKVELEQCRETLKFMNKSFGITL